MKELNSRQWSLYNYLKDAGDSWTSQATLIKELYTAELKAQYGANYMQELSENNYHDSTARQTLTVDIRAINDSTIIQKIILSGNKGNKLATAEEAKTYIGNKINAAVAALNRAKHIAAKAQLNGQMRIVLGKERDIIQSFLDS